MIERIDNAEDAAKIRMDYYIDSCPWCGDELIDEKCARRCHSSRVNRTDG